ncbi:MAG TPA: hypothetical protein VFY38_13380 [Pseudonocardia sp.]|nr:hypothetical protein [Pseudonocardia sp.]
MNIRADGIAVVLGPLLRDVRIVAAALIDLDSGMVLDAWSADATGAPTGSPELELIGAQHAEIVRTALALLHSWPAGGGAPGTCEVVLGADDGPRHLLRTVPDPYGDRLALAVVVNGSQRVLDRVRKRLEAVSVDALTAGPSMTRRPVGSGWSFDAPGPDVPAHPEPGAGLVPVGLGSRPSPVARAPGPEYAGMPVPVPRGAEQAGRPVPRGAQQLGLPAPRGSEPGPVLRLPGQHPAGQPVTDRPAARKPVAGSAASGSAPASSGPPRPPSPPAALPAPAPSPTPRP